MPGGSLDEAHVVPRAGTRLHYWIVGPETGPVVVFSHGASLDHRLFDTQIHAVVHAGYRAVVWDMRGHGHSKPLGEPRMTTRTLAEDLLAVLDALGAREPVCLVGQSLGGYVAQEVTFVAPERVAALVIIGATCATLPIPRWQQWALKSSPWWFRIWPDQHLRRLIARSTAATQQGQQYAHEATRQLSKREFVAVWQAVTEAIHPDEDYRIEQPVLLCHGDGDRTGTVARQAPRWAARDPHCQYEIIPNARHNANHDNPGRFNSLLLDFLGEHYPASEQQ